MTITTGEIVSALTSAGADLSTDGRPARLSPFEVAHLNECPAWDAEPFEWTSHKLTKALTRRALAIAPADGELPPPTELVRRAVDHEMRQRTSHGAWLESLGPIARASAVRGAVAKVTDVIATMPNVRSVDWHTGRRDRVLDPPGIRVDLDPDARHRSPNDPRHWLVVFAPADPAVFAVFGGLVGGTAPGTIGLLDTDRRTTTKVPVDDALLSDGISRISEAVHALHGQRHGPEPTPVAGRACSSCRHRVTCPAVAAHVNLDA
jgi:hypothetical protein